MIKKQDLFVIFVIPFCLFSLPVRVHISVIFFMGETSDMRLLIFGKEWFSN